MDRSFIQHSAFNIPHSRRNAFSLVELLTVIFIISLLIAILVPSLGAARNAAKKMTTSKEIDSIKVGLEMFKNENGPEFPQTNGYPPSFAHPPIPGALTPEEARLGKFPFLESKPEVTGAHWLPAMLMGPDKLGYIKRSSIPNKDTLRAEPWKWYTPDPLGDGITTLSHGGPYVDVGLPTKKTMDLSGRAGTARPPDYWDKIQDRPVVVDAFDQAILYYAANAHGRTSNMVHADRPANNEYPGGAQQDGPPFYFHQDNIGFTGDNVIDPIHGNTNGWDFGNSGAKHTIARSGAADTALDLLNVEEIEHRETFARYIVDRKIYRGFEPPAPSPIAASPLRPVNADSYLLISAGVDGRYGTNDDVSNLPPWTD